ncbi:MAG: GGDEF domain-containing protein [Planctomycetes bacterium]|nr:GGDEF domain-containing protein [Planctomycetota bacterium]
MAERPPVPPPHLAAAPSGAAQPHPSSEQPDPGHVTRPAQALLCDHRGAGALDHSRLLARLGFEVVVSTTLRRTLELLAQATPALILIDPLAGSGGAELNVIDRARRREHGSGLLVLVDEHAPLPPSLATLRSASNGAWDWLRRSAFEDEIATRIELLMRQVAQEREMERLRHVATHDDRTDLLRPQVFQDQLRQHFSASQRHNLNMALLLIDLDNFGRVNKDFDHTVGDTVIARVGAAIRRSLRAEDVAARLGGDEFSVLLPYTRKVDAARVVQRLLEHIRECGEGSSKGRALQVSASIGFETFNGSDLDNVERLRLHAEEALRNAKRLGGDRGVYYRNLDSARRESGSSASAD